MLKVDDDWTSDEVAAGNCNDEVEWDDDDDSSKYQKTPATTNPAINRITTSDPNPRLLIILSEPHAPTVSRPGDPVVVSPILSPVGSRTGACLVGTA
jgi:hypothetical protein